MSNGPSYLLYTRIAGRNIQRPQIRECPAPRIQHRIAERIILGPSGVAVPQLDAEVYGEAAIGRVRKMFMGREVRLLPSIELRLAVEALHIIGAR